MNNIYKVIWSKAKNCYVVASEIARSHTKSATGSEKIGGVTRRSLLASLMALSLLCGGLGVAEASVHVNEVPDGTKEVYTIGETYSRTEADARYAKANDVTENTTNIATNKANITALQTMATEQGKLITTNTANIANNTTAIEKKINAETANERFATKVDLTALQNQVTGKVDENTFEDALVDKADKTYVDTEVGKKANKATTLTGYGITDAYTKDATDTAITTKVNEEKDARELKDAELSGRIDTLSTTVDSKVSETDLNTTLGNYYTQAQTNAAIKTAVDDEKNARDTAIKGEVTERNKAIGDAIASEVTNRDAAITKAKTELKEKVTAEETARKEEDAKLEGKIKENTTAINNEKAEREAADIALSDRIGTVDADGKYIKKSGTNNVSENLKVLDDQAKKNADAITAEETARTNKDNELEGKIKTNADNIQANKKAIVATDKRTGGITRNDAATETTIEGHVTVDNLGNVTAKGKLIGDGVDAGSLNVENASHLKGDVTMDNKLSVTGDTKLGALNVTGESSLKDTQVNGTLTTTGQATFKEAVEMDKGLTVTSGDTTLKGTKVDGKLTVTDDADLKNTTVGGTLGVTGATTLSGELTAKENATFEKDVTVKEDLTVKGELKTDKISMKNTDTDPDGTIHRSATTITADGITHNGEVEKSGVITKSQFTHTEEGSETYAKKGNTANWTETRSDVKADGVKTKVEDSKKNRTNTSQTADGIKGYATDKDGNKTYTKVTATENSFQVQDKDGKNKNHQVNTMGSSVTEIKNDEGKITKTEQTAENITNTAKDGTIKNDAKDIVNNASGNISNKSQTMDTTVTGKATESYGSLDTTVNGNETHIVKGTKTETVDGKVTENYNAGQATKVTGNQDIHVTGKQTNTVEGGQENIISGGQINSITGDQTTTVTGDISNVAENITNEAKTQLTDKVGDNTRVTTSTSITDTVGTANRKIENDKITDTAGDSTVTTENGKGTTFAKTGSTAYSTETGAPTDTNIAGNHITTGRVDANELGVSDKDGTNTAKLTVEAGEGKGVKASAGNGTTTGSLDVKADEVGSSVTDGTGKGSTFKQRIDAIMGNVKTDAGESEVTQKGDEITSVVGKDEATNSRVTQKKGSLEAAVTDGTNTNVSYDVANASAKVLTDGTKVNKLQDNLYSSEKTITNGTYTTSKVQTALDITNTAKDGTITHDAKDIVNNASNSITDKVGEHTRVLDNEGITDTVGGSTFKQRIDKIMMESKDVSIKAEETLTNEAKVITNKASEVINNEAVNINNTATGIITSKASEIKNQADKLISNKVGENTWENMENGKITTSIKDGAKQNLTQSDAAGTTQSTVDGGKSTVTIQNADGLTDAVTDGTNTSVQNQTASAIAAAVKDGAGNENASVANATTSANTITNGTKANTVISTADGTRFINSEAAAPVGDGTEVKTTIKGNTITTGKVTMDYAEVMKDLGVRGNANIAGKTTTGELEVTGKSTLKGDVTMESNATVKKDLTVEGTTTTKTLKVTENATVGGTLDVAKKATFQDAVDIAKDLSVGGNATIKGDVTAKSYKVGDKTYISADGINANDQKITNVADGSISEGSKDAVNGGQLYGMKRDLEHQVDKVGANAAAMANLHPMEFDPGSKWNIAAAMGNYGSETAAALGAFYRPNDDVMVNLSTAFGTGENMVGGGVSVRLGKGGNKLSREESNALKAQVADLTARMDALLSVLNPNMSKDFPDVPENHWAYEAVSRLAGNDIIQGYPDGEFHGERTMTRYEMAEIIYNALSRGAEAEKELVEEFKPELQAMAASEKATAERAEG